MLRIILQVALILVYQYASVQVVDATSNTFRKPLTRITQNEIKPLFKQTALIPFEKSISLEATQILAKTQAMLHILDTVAKSLRTHHALRFQKLSTNEYVALASMLYRMKLTSTLTTKDTKEFVEAHASLYPPLNTLDTSTKHIQELFKYPTQIVLREHVLISLNILLSEALETLKIPKPNTIKTNTLVRHIQTLTDYLQLLSEYHDEWDNSSENLEKLLHMHKEAPNDPLIALGLAEIFLQQNQMFDAKKNIDITLEAFPNMAHAYYIRGLINLNLRLPTLASNDFNLAIKIQPETAKFWRTLGIALSMSGQKKAMCEVLYKACSLGDCKGLINARKIGFCNQVIE